MSFSFPTTSPVSSQLAPKQQDGLRRPSSEDHVRLIALEDPNAQPSGKPRTRPDMWASFFDIPVYRLTEKEYNARQSKHIDKEITREKHSYYIKKMYEEDPQEECMQHHLQKSYGGPWDFNEIIGWKRLYYYGDQVRGEWWKIDRATKSKSRHKLAIVYCFPLIGTGILKRVLSARDRGGIFLDDTPRKPRLRRSAYRFFRLQKLCH